MADIKDKIAKLLALAESDNENEAKQALLRARELMAKHKMRPEECQKAENVKVMRATLDINCTAMTNPWATALACCIAENYCCRAYRLHKQGGKTNTIGLVGLEEDFEICKSVLLYAYDCVMSYCKHQISRNPWEPAGTYRKKCNAYGYGFVYGLDKAFEEQKEKNQEWGLVLVVPKAVDDSMQDMGKKSSFGRDGTDLDTVAYRAQGYNDGKAFDPKHRVAASPARAALRG